mmetsp:Transcript_31062/g.35383  ORF Transcript_31062/g.35383 Transcript_31062/m.35383 type:complete len:314 (-) Transcript_31062:202-1143(-)|eukprot:CAMPEP_0194129402 /NCGR_PEP_ID=MMETSP0152-20130528/640_1 /TAXON_ID=1049557 /ORGANISM="Thalassiothrix antarctica, Strain L6-D1" /LENGTH=313 /DNA_ID=CAMNT_0038823585 /DNA_START=69 /DNA_END=1010 /DNA_ORIENTATION=+
MNSEVSLNRDGQSNSDECAVDAVNPYAVLHVRRDATPSEIREAYRRLALWHHPGRLKGTSEDELRRRSEVFETIAVCYEVLFENESRQKYDILLQKYLECHGKGSSLKKLWTASTSSTEPDRYPDSSVFGCGRCTSMNEDHLYLPSLIKSYSSEDSDEQRELESLVTSDEPLGLLKISRNKKPFSDPYVLFERIFGSKIYPRSDKFSPNLSVLHHGTVTSAWTGSTRLLRDGTLRSRTTRVVHDRKLTRTELISKDVDGQKCIHVTVVSEELEKKEVSESKPTSPFIFGINDGSWKDRENPCDWLVYFTCGKS